MPRCRDLAREPAPAPLMSGSTSEILECRRMLNASMRDYFRGMDMVSPKDMGMETSPVKKYLYVYIISPDYS